MQKVHVIGYSVQKLEWKQTDGRAKKRMNGRMETILLSQSRYAVGEYRIRGDDTGKAQVNEPIEM